MNQRQGRRAYLLRCDGECAPVGRCRESQSDAAVQVERHGADSAATGIRGVKYCSRKLQMDRLPLSTCLPVNEPARSPRLTSGELPR